MIITLDTPKTQYDKFIFETTKGIFTKDKLTTFPAYEKEVTFSVPTVESVEVIGNKTIRVNFSEAVSMSPAFVTAAGSKFKIDGQSLLNYGFASATVVDPTNINQYAQSIELTFNVALPTGSHTLTIPAGDGTDLTDAAGFKVAETTKTFTVDAVTNVPKVVTVEGENNGTVYVTFDRAMDSTTATDNTLYSIAGTQATSATFVSGSGNKKVKLVFSGTVVKGANVLVIDKDIEDVYGNKLEENNDLRVSFNATEDKVKPTVSTITLIDNRTIRVKFSETVNAVYAENLANYTLKDSAGRNITSNISSIDAVPTSGANSDTYDITLSAPLTGSQYSLTIKNIEDLAATPNTIDEVTKTFSGIDDVAPTAVEAYEVVAQGSKVTVFFSEAMDVSTVTNKANYAYQDGTGAWKALPSGTTISVGEGDKSVIITFPSNYKTLTGNADAYEITKIRVSNVKDKAGNVLDGVAEELAITPNGTSSQAPAIVADTFVLKASGSKVIAEVECDRTIANLDINDFAVESQTPDSGYVSVYSCHFDTS